MSPKKRLVYVHGLSGAMGQQIAHVLLDDENFSIANSTSSREINLTELSSADFVIDFSTKEGSISLAKFFGATPGLSKKIVLVGTTGFSKPDLDNLDSHYAKSACKVLLAPNTSLGMRVFLKQVSSAAADLYPQKFDIEIIETHHQRKLDAPSGTALLIAESIQRKLPARLELTFSHTKKRMRESIGIHSVRGGNVFGEHEVRFLGAAQELSFKHRAFSRTLFAEGAVSLLLEIEQRKDFRGVKHLLDWLDDA